MALSPSLPTSFVPKQAVDTTRQRFTRGGNNVLLIVAIVILSVTLVVAGAEFIYVQILTNEEQAKSAQILADEKAISPTIIVEFTRLQDRLSSAQTLLNQHIELSQFFNLLESVTSQSVHFDGVSIDVADDRSAKISMTGEAKNFNALASESTVFSNQKYIKAAVFSGFAINKDNSVSFSLNADLDPAIIIGSAPPSQQNAPVFGPQPVVAPPSTSPAKLTSTTTTP